MKRLWVILPLLFILSCEDKKEIIEPIDEVIEPVSIIGKWYYHSYNINNTIHHVDNCTQKGYFEFLEEGVGSYVTYKIKNSKCTLYDSMNVNWSFQDEKYSIQTFWGDGRTHGLPPSAGIIYQHYGVISDSILSVDGYLNFKQ